MCVKNELPIVINNWGTINLKSAFFFARRNFFGGYCMGSIIFFVVLWAGWPLWTSAGSCPVSPSSLAGSLSAGARWTARSSPTGRSAHSYSWLVCIVRSFQNYCIISLHPYFSSSEARIFFLTTIFLHLPQFAYAQHTLKKEFPTNISSFSFLCPRRPKSEFPDPLPLLYFTVQRPLLSFV